MRDYLDVEYDEERRPLSEYPDQLAGFLMQRTNMVPGKDVLELGIGRAEVAAGFVRRGLLVTGIDASSQAQAFADIAGAKFVHHEMKTGEWIPFRDESFDYVFSKSFIEHVHEPLDCLAACFDVLRPGGRIVFLTPDWEANFKIFFDDVSHVSPFTRISMRQALELSGFGKVEAFRFRQLPATWNSPFFAGLSKLIAPFAPLRANNKFLRWSRELMLCGVAEKPAHA